MMQYLHWSQLIQENMWTNLTEDPILEQLLMECFQHKHVISCDDVPHHDQDKDRNLDQDPLTIPRQSLSLKMETLCKLWVSYPCYFQRNSVSGPNQG
jgi:hypothetical protein